MNIMCVAHAYLTFLFYFGNFYIGNILVRSSFYEMGYGD